jgi:uncharacterized protein (TIGR02270 family)
VASTVDAEVFEQHVLEAGFLWSMRDGAARDPAYDLDALSQLDERVEAHLDGLRLSGDAGWECARSALAEAEAGEVFTAAAVAVQRADLRGLAHVLDVGGGEPELSRGIVSALGWIPFEQVRRILPGLLDGRCPPELHYLGVAACAAHRHDPGSALGYAAVAGDPRLRARALRAIGELGRMDLLPELRRELGSADEECRFAAAWSAALLGDADAARPLWDVASAGGPRAARACDMAMRRMDPAAAHTWLESLSGRRESLRAALAGAAALGDPVSVPWLLDQLADPESARAAGLALTMITGADLAALKLAAPAPKDHKAGPTDDPGDDDVAMDPDDGLPWPDADGLRAYWGREAGRFKRGTRYLLGKPAVTPRWLDEVLKSGSQPARAAAAIELRVRDPGRAVFEVRAPGFRQRRELGGH